MNKAVSDYMQPEPKKDHMTTMRQHKNFRVIGPSNPNGQYCMTLRGAKRVGRRWQKEGREAFIQESYGYGTNNWQTMEYLDAK